MRLRLQWVLAAISLILFASGYLLMMMASQESAPFDELSREEQEQIRQEQTADWIRNLVELSDEEKTIYDAILNQWAEISDYPRGRMVSSKLSSGLLQYMDGELLNDPVEYETVSEEMARSYLEARKIPACLSQADVTPPIVVRGEDYCRTGNNKPPRLDLEERQKTGPVHDFSRIGFNSDHDQVVLAYGYGCGPLCGFGGIVTLSKVTGEWVVNGAYMEWIS